MIQSIDEVTDTDPVVDVLEYSIFMFFGTSRFIHIHFHVNALFLIVSKFDLILFENIDVFCLIESLL